MLIDPRTRNQIVRIAAAAVFSLLAGCAIHPDASSHAFETPDRWNNDDAGISPSSFVYERWWTRLDDPAIDALISVTLSDNPTLAEAMARVDQARAILDASRAARWPHLDVSGGVSYGEQASGTASAVDATSASISPALSWELDLWGRLRQTERAAQNRLDARTADARDARLSVAAQLASGVVRLRACNYALAVRDRDIASRTRELELMRERLSVGNVAPVDVASARSNLASAEIDRIRQKEQCAREVNALVALSGVEENVVLPLLALSPGEDADNAMSPGRKEAELNETIPAPPPLYTVLPAEVLLGHPSIIAAEHEAEARWAETGVAKAERMPRFDLVAILTGQWIRAAGSTTSLTTWSIGPEVSGTIFDAGLGAANVRAADARYRESVAALQRTVRTTVQDIEDRLAARQSAEQRVIASQEAVDAARFALDANEARWRSGAINLFELEDSRRQYNLAQESAINAARDRAEAWVELIRVSGNAFELNAPPAASVPPPEHPLISLK